MMKKATRKQVKRHNRQLVLRHIYESDQSSRASLAELTGLTKPTISTIVAELIEQGYVEEVGQGSSTSSGGKRPTLLNFVPTARQIIGLTVNSEEVVGCLAYLDQNITVRHHTIINEGDLIIDRINDTINALLAQLDAPLLCISVGVAGIVDDLSGVVRHSHVLGWEQLPLAQQLSDRYDVPVYVDNNTELAARAEVITRPDLVDALVILLISDSIEIGIAFAGDRFHHGGDLGAMMLPNQKRVSELEWRHIRTKAESLAHHYPHGFLAADKPSFVRIAHGVFLADEASQLMMQEIADGLSEVYAWIIGMMRPDEIVLSGAMSDAGEQLIHEVTHRLKNRVASNMIETVRFSLARSLDQTLLGAVVGALHHELGVV